MKGLLEKEELMRSLYILTQPTRLKIINTLQKAGKPLYIEQIAEKIDCLDRRSVSFHLTTLAQHGFVKGSYREIEEPHSKGKAAKFYELTGKVEEVFSCFKEPAV